MSGYDIPQCDMDDNLEIEDHAPGYDIPQCDMDDNLEMEAHAPGWCLSIVTVLFLIWSSMGLFIRQLFGMWNHC
jgi:hypothetical protein